MKVKFKLASLIAVLAFSCLTIAVKAQGGPGGPGDPGLDPDPGPGTNVPFDGGISLVIAAGIAYASKKGYDKRKKARQDETEK